MLIRNKEELKAQLGGLNKNIEWATWAPFIEQAERKHLRPWLGAQLLQWDVLYWGLRCELVR